MPLSVTCPTCGKSYRVKPELAGKKFRCQQCNSVVAIPIAPLLPEVNVEALLPPGVPAAHAPSTLPNPTAMPAAPAPNVLQIPPAPAAPFAVGIHAPNAVTLPQIKVAKKKGLEPSKLSGRFLFWLIFIGVLVPSLFVATTFISTEWTQNYLLYFLLPVILIVSVTWQISLLRVAFREGTAHLFMCLFVPLYAFYYVISRWRYTARLICVMLAYSAAISVIGSVTIIQALNDPSPARPLQRSGAQSGMVISSQNQTSGTGASATSAPTTSRQMTPEEVAEVHAQMQRTREEAKRRAAEHRKEHERRMQEHRDSIAKALDQAEQSGESNSEPTPPSSAESKRSFSNDEVEKISMPATKGSDLKPDQTVFVSSAGGWYECKVLESDGENPKIHYLGWSDSWDEKVPLDRVRVPKP